MVAPQNLTPRNLTEEFRHLPPAPVVAAAAAPIAVVAPIAAAVVAPVAAVAGAPATPPHGIRQHNGWAPVRHG